MMAGNGDLSTAKLAAIGPVRYVRGRYALKFVTFSAVNFRRHVVSFSLAVAASCFQDLESNDAQRYSLMKTIPFSRSGVRFPLHYDECHRAYAHVSAWLAQQQQPQPHGDWCGLMMAYGCDWFRERLPTSIVRQSSADRRPFTRPFLWCDLAAHVPSWDVYDAGQACLVMAWWHLEVISS